MLRPGYGRAPGLLAAVAIAAAAGPGCDGTSIGERRSPTIYGDDDRQDWFAHPSAELRELTRGSIAALVSRARLDLCDPEVAVPVGPTLAEAEDLCDDQRFRDDPVVAGCSATLIDDDVIVTAGHCIDDEAECRTRRVVFDFFHQAEGQLAVIDHDDVYSCRRLLVRENGFVEGVGVVDYALVQLDRPVDGERAPAEVIASAAEPAVGDPVVTIGFPSGIPAKIDDGGEVLSIGPNMFQATSDAFPGNSGSGVFDVARRVIGTMTISQGGGYAPRDDDDCYVVFELPPEGMPPGTATGIVPVRRGVDALCAAGWPSERLCGVPAACGDRTCSGRETAGDCPDDCPAPACGDLVCDVDEDLACPGDCGDEVAGDCAAVDAGPEPGADAGSGDGDGDDDGGGGCGCGTPGGGGGSRLLPWVAALAALAAWAPGAARRRRRVGRRIRG